MWTAELTNPRQADEPFDLGSPFTVEGDTLTFTGDHDTCKDRAETLVTHPWTRRR